MIKRLLDILWLLALGAFVFALPPTFHGDEPMQIYMSRDYATAFIDHNLTALETAPPYPIDSDQELRLINGSLNRYVIGLSWHLAGLSVNDLPPRPGWEWYADYATNVRTGYLPAPALLSAARFSSTLFLAFSIAVIFALGWQFRHRPLAYLVSGLYAINPVVLLNGRRAMQEGSLLFFGLLVILLAVLISKHHEQSRRGGFQTRHYPIGVLWLGLIFRGGWHLPASTPGSFLWPGRSAGFLWPRRCG